MGIIRFLSGIFNGYVQLVHRFMGEEKGVWTAKDFILLMTMFSFFLFSILLLFYYFRVI